MFEIGTTLRDARVRRDISLQQAEDETKIRVKYIQALENEDFDVLPGGTYVKGFLRTYAEYLGLDYQLLLDEFNEKYGSGDHREHLIGSLRDNGKDKMPRASGRQTSRSYLLVAALAVAIIAVLAYLGWGNSASNEPTLVTTTESEARTDTSTPAETTRTQTQTQAQTTAEGLETITFNVSDSASWLELRRESNTGTVVWSGTLQPGDSKTISKADMGAATLWLRVGSAAGLEVLVNGEPQELADKAPLSYVITAAGMRQG